MRRSRLKESTRLVAVGRFIQIACVAGLVGAALLSSPASAQEESSKLRIELNRLEPQGEHCRIYLLVKNGRSEALKSLKVDLFAFDAQGVAHKRLAVELGPISSGKTRVKVFDIVGAPCPVIGSLLLNDVLSCEGETGSWEDCLDHVETSSKQRAVPLIK